MGRELSRTFLALMKSGDPVTACSLTNAFRKKAGESQGLRSRFTSRTTIFCGCNGTTARDSSDGSWGLQIVWWDLSRASGNAVVLTITTSKRLSL